MSIPDENPIKIWLNWAKTRAATAGAFVGVALLLAILTGVMAFHMNPDFQVQTEAPKRLTTSRGATIASYLRQYDRSQDEFDGATVRALMPRSSDVVQDLIDDNVQVLGNATADETGFAQVDIPATQREWLENPSSTQVSIVLHTNVDGDERWSRTELPLDDDAVLAIALDRPLYQPGQTVLMRFLAVDQDTGEPRADQDLELSIRDPRHNLIYRETLKPSAAGVFTAELPLASGGLQGRFQLAARVGKTEEFRSFEVRPFQLPRFKVAVDLDQTAVAGGDMLTGRVKALYTYGDPVRDAEVTLTVKTTANAVELMNLPVVAKTIRGSTDRNGRLLFNWSLPAQLGANTKVELTATVASQSGRTEKGSTSLFTSGGISLELVPANRAEFERNQSNTGYLLVRDSQRRGIADANVQLILAESGRERTVELVSDEHGRVKFDWAPGGQDSYISARIELATGAVIKQNLTPRLVDSRNEFRILSPLAHAGEPLELELLGDRDAVLLATSHGVPLFGQRVSKDSRKVTITLPAGSEGLVDLVYLHPNGRAEQKVWVQQAGGQTVGMKAHKSGYRPGEQAQVDLTFPPAKTNDPTVTFGLVGVDEALYALKERAEVPLPVLMRGLPESLALAFSAPMPTDADGQAIYNSRLKTSLQVQDTDQLGRAYTMDITRDVKMARRAPYRKAWAVILYLLLGLTVFAAARTTWRSVTKSAFSWRRVFALFGAAMLAGLFGVALAVFRMEALLGGALVWSTVVVAWVLGASVRNENLPIDRWLGLNVMVLIMATMVYATIEPLSSTPLQEYFPMIAAGVPLVLFGIEVLLWVFVAYREREAMAAFGLAALVGAMLMGPTGVTMSRFGTSFDSAPRVMEMEAQEEPMAKAGRGAPPGQALSMGPSTGEQPARENPRVRSWFPETMVWIPDLDSNKDGNATAKFELPDSITTWRLNAWAHTRDGRFGEGQLGITVTQPFFVELDLPVHLIAGDTIDVPVTFVNNSEEVVTTPVRALGDDQIRVSSLPPSVTIPAGERTLLWLRITALRHGQGAVTVSAGDKTTGDAVRRVVTIAPNGREVRDTYSGMINDGWVQPVAIPSDAIQDTTHLNVEVYANAISDAFDGLDSMLRTPQGCFEQTSSVNFPNVMILQTLKATTPAKWPKGGFDSPLEAWTETHRESSRLVRLGYQKMLTFRQPSGGFALYPENAETDLMLTAYGLMQLAEMRKVTTVDPDVIRGAVQYLVRSQNPDGSWPVFATQVSGARSGGTDFGQVRGTSFITLALIMADRELAQQAIDLGLNRIEARLDAAGGGDALAFAANALVAGKREAAARKAVDRLITSVTRLKDTAYWESPWGTWMGGYGRYATVETTALAAYAMIQSGAGAETLPLALNHMAQARSGYGGWGTTQATVWSLRTLNALREKQNPTSLQINLDGDPVPRADGQTGAGLLELTGEPSPLVGFAVAPPRTGNSVVTIASTAQTSAMAKAVVKFHVPWSSPKATDKPGTTMTVQAETPPVVTVTEPTKTVVWLENPTEDQIRTLIIEAPVAPGAFVDTDALDEMRTNRVIDEYEVLPTHVRLYVSELGAKRKLGLTIPWIPFFAGSVTLPPVRAYRFYTPEPVAESKGGQVRMVRR